MKSSIAVLLIEDSATDAKLIVATLRTLGIPMETERVEDAEAMRSALARRSWDLILSDWSMPRFSALAALEVLQKSKLDVPFVIVSGTIGEETAVDAMRAGAADYVIKDRIKRLIPVVERELRESADRTARRTAEDALQTEQARFRAMIEKSEDGISLMAADATMVYISPAAQTILGHGRENRVGQSGFGMIHPDDAERLGANFAAIVASPGVSIPFELRVAHPDGSWRWIEGTARNMLHDPSIAAIVSNFRDISQRKQSIEALRESEERYRRIIETTNEGVWLMDADARTRFVNARMAMMLGRRPDEVLNRSPLDFLTEDNRARFAAILPHLNAGVSDQIEAPFVRPDGTTIWTLIEATPIRDAAGQFDGALAMVMDITARKRAEASLLLSEARFRCLWESGLIMVTIFDVGGVIREINDAGLAMLGYERDELIAGAKRWADITPAEWHAADDKARAQLSSSGTARPWEKELIRKDRTRVPIVAGAAMLGDSEGIAIALDLTDRRRAELALRQSEDQLRQAQKMEAVGRLAGGVAHDFNNVLSVILSLSELAILDLAPGEPLHEDLREIQRAGERAAAMTRQLLMFSRQQVIQPKVLGLGELVANMEKLLLRLVGEDVDLAIRCTASVGRVRVDPSSIEQLVMNLVVNARDAMPTGGKLTIEAADVVLDETYAIAHHGVTAGQHVMLAVTDTGSGIDKATMSRIFEPFFTTKAIGKGTGLGLSTVFGIVQQSGGSVWVYSEVDHGTTFKIYLPRVDAAAEAEPARIPTELLAGTETVLLVEDEDAVRLTARSILRRQGYTVIEARNAGEALLTCERTEGTIHIMLSDVVMPLMSGPALALRLAESRPGMKVLCMSGYTDDSIVRHGVLEGSFAFIQKPFTPETLARKVREVLDAPSSTPAG